MNKILGSVPERSLAVTDRILHTEFKSAIGSEYATNGLARRVFDIAYSLSRVFEVLPPDTDNIPSRKQRSEATAHLQAVLFNVYGCFENLAWVWVAETGLVRPDGKPLRRAQIGFGSKCEIVRRSLPDPLRSQISDLDQWFGYLEEFRHSTAHRIPLYIPPFMLDPAKEDQYRKLDRQAHEALGRRKFDEYESLIDSRDSLRHFRPIALTSVNEINTALIHPQLLTDFATVELWVELIFNSLP